MPKGVYKRDRPSEAFVERPETDRAPRGRRISLRVGDDGKIDWDNVPEKTKQLYKEIVPGDQFTVQSIAEADGETAVDPLAVTPEHVKCFLDGFAWLERQAAYRIVDKKTRKPFIKKEVAAQVFVFTDQQKDMLAPSGAQFANETFPEWLRKFIFNAGPGAQFFGLMAFITMGQVQKAVDLSKRDTQGDLEQPSPTPDVQPINGHVVDSFVEAPVESVI